MPRVRWALSLCSVWSTERPPAGPILSLPPRPHWGCGPLWSPEPGGAAPHRAPPLAESRPLHDRGACAAVTARSLLWGWALPARAVNVSLLGKPRGMIRSHSGFSENSRESGTSSEAFLKITDHNTEDSTELRAPNSRIRAAGASMALLQSVALTEPCAA